MQKVGSISTIIGYTLTFRKNVYDMDGGQLTLQHLQGTRLYACTKFIQKIAENIGQDLYYLKIANSTDTFLCYSNNTKYTKAFIVQLLTILLLILSQ